MTALLIVHDVDDVDHWLASPKRRELMGPRGYTVRTFVDPSAPGRAGLIIEGATLADFEELLKSPETADAMKHDGVHPDTLQVLEER
jgi:hypothetical protein